MFKDEGLFTGDLSDVISNVGSLQMALRGVMARVSALWGAGRRKELCSKDFTVIFLVQFPTLVFTDALRAWVDAGRWPTKEPWFKDSSVIFFWCNSQRRDFTDALRGDTIGLGFSAWGDAGRRKALWFKDFTVIFLCNFQRRCLTDALRGDDRFGLHRMG